MTERIIIANLISFVAALMLTASCLFKSREKIYFFQFLECVLLIFSQILFGNIASAAVLLLAAVRNVLLFKRKYNAPAAASVFVLTLVFGILLNSGFISLLPVVATLIYSLSTYFAKSFVQLKMSLFVNLLIWIVYSFLILDISSFVINIISFVLNLLSLIKERIASREI